MGTCEFYTSVGYNRSAFQFQILISIHGAPAMTTRDYAHDIEQIRSALFHATGSRASVMVGAGFSFNGQRRYASAKNFPSWPALTESLVNRLYPDDEKRRKDALRNAGATSGALRIAQEFEAAFGRTVLLNHLRDMLPDREHEPGPLHKELLSLPWADVFTTNYDTLLERAAPAIREQRYEVVRCLTDLPLKRAPRIVKLHGTLPELNDCILTEEDFRTYPERFSPFVAEVEVAMVESHLCLVGFSGDDPNFLAWSGWVRDRLGKQTLPIYLCTFEAPTPFQTRMLEQRFVIPLPLAIITGKSDHQSALRAFFDILKKPPDEHRPRWCLPRQLKNERPLDEPKYLGAKAPTPEEWLSAAKVWRDNRQLYPGWLVPHVKAITDIWESTESWAGRAEQNPEELLSLEPALQIWVLHELLWRIRRALFPAYDRLALTTWEEALQRYYSWRSSQQEGTRVTVPLAGPRLEISIHELDAAAMELLTEQLRHSRETGKLDRFHQVCNQINMHLASVSGSQQDHVKHFVQHQTALAYFATWNDTASKKLLLEWETSNVPTWTLRRAGLFN